jgi:hypothetical protein
MSIDEKKFELKNKNKIMSYVAFLSNMNFVRENLSNIRTIILHFLKFKLRDF